MDGLCIINPMEMCDIEFSCSSKITSSLQSKIMNQAKDNASGEEIQTNLKTLSNQKMTILLNHCFVYAKKMNDEQRCISVADKFIN